ncbi:MAG: TonB-dependent receptor [Candidatus Sulfotelmatobacter sp.]|nr:TonB-dependent receptor [Candidatus Sulfotelmatobacter sp.]
MRSISCFLFFTLLISVMSAAAQSDRGTIAGTVKDSTGAVLPGARVELQQKGPSAVSDGQGQFLISNLAAGDYAVVVSYVGFSTFTTTAKVAAGQIVQLDAVLKVESASQVVTVSGDRQLGEVEAINIERTADNIVQVLPSQVITSLPNTNIADAVGRLPSVSLERDEGEGKYVQIRGTEPRLSNLTINGINVPSPEGNVRNIKMDIIPSSIVDRIEVNKTLSANQDGDAIGGSVNLVTKTASERPTLDLEGQGGYTNIIGGRWLDAFNGTLGQRAGTRKQWGFLLGGTYDWNGRGINDLEPAPGVTSLNGINYPFFAGADLRTYRYHRTRYGFAPEVDYVLKPGSSVYFKGLYSDFHDFGETYVYTPNVGSLVAVNGSQYTFDNTGFMQYRQYIRRPDQQIYSGMTGGRHDLTSNLITYEFAVSRSHNIGGQDFGTTRFNGGPISQPGIQINLDTTNPYEPKFPVVGNVNIFDPTQYVASSYTIPNYASSQLNFEGAASYARRYSTHEHYGNFEIGLKIRNGHKTQSENDFIYDNQPGSVTLANVLSTFTNPTYYDGAYKFGPMSDYNKIIQQVGGNLSQLGFDQSASISNSIPAGFDANERVYAGYLMNTIGFGKLSLQGGVRFEATDATYRSGALDVSGNPTSVAGASNYVNVLPSVQLQYRLQQNTNLRGSFGIGISRPNFSDIVPSRSIDPNTSPYPTISAGNPALKPTRANNYDILVEHYFRPYGILQAGFFYKTLSDAIYSTRTRFTNNTSQCVQYPICDVLESINGPSGHITGFEASWEQRLAFLPGLLNGLGVALNYSYTSSQVTFPAGFNADTPSASNPNPPGRADHPTLQRQAPNNYNVGLTYDKKRLSLRFAMSHNDASIYSYFWINSAPTTDPVLGLRGPNGDQYLYAHTQYDVQGSYRLYKGLSFVAYGLNLSNEAFGFYQGSKQYPIQREFYHPTASFGFRWTSAGE